MKLQITALSPNASPENPIDLTGQVANDPPIYAKALDAVLTSGGFDLAYCSIGLIAGLPFIKQPLLDSLREAAARHGAVAIAASITAPPETLEEYEAAGFLCYREPARAIKALAALGSFAAAWDRPPNPAYALAGLPAITTGQVFSEAAAKALLAEIGVPAPAEHLVRDAPAALAAAASIGRPVAIKVVSPDILHKTEVGGVALGVAPDQAGACLLAMAETVAAAAPAAHIEGYLVTPMLSGGVECIVGVHTDPLLGPVVMFGLGGVLVELMKDVVTRLAPVSAEEAREMIQAVKGFPLLNGFRGRPKADIPALAQAIAAISRLAAANAKTVRTIEVNPLLVMNETEGVLALDAVIET